MHTHVHLHTYRYIFMYIHTHIQTHNVLINVNTLITHVKPHIHTLMYICTQKCKWIHTYLDMHKDTCRDTCSLMWWYTHICIDIHSHTHIYIYHLLEYKHTPTYTYIIHSTLLLAWKSDSRFQVCLYRPCLDSTLDATGEKPLITLEAFYNHYWQISILLWNHLSILSIQKRLVTSIVHVQILNF